MNMNLYNKIIFIPMIMISSISITISNTWFSNWMIMEINMISFLSLIIFNKNQLSTNSFNYFFIQSFNSYIYLASSMTFNYMSNDIINFILYEFIYLSIFTKMGMPPFYMWYMKIMSNLNWNLLFMLSTIQKFIPLMILNQMINSENLISMYINLINLIVFSFFAALLGLHNLNIKLILTYSSIIQMSWIIILMHINEINFINYFLFYSLIMFSLTKIFNLFNINYIYDLSKIKFTNYWMYFIYLWSILSLASIPPSSGFLLKWMTIQTLSMNVSFMLNMIMIINSLISIYFYFNLIFISILNYSNSIKFNYLNINFNSKMNKILILMNWTMLTFLLIYKII